MQNRTDSRKSGLQSRFSGVFWFRKNIICNCICDNTLLTDIDPRGYERISHISFGFCPDDKAGIVCAYDRCVLFHLCCNWCWNIFLMFPDSSFSFRHHMQEAVLKYFLIMWGFRHHYKEQRIFSARWKVENSFFLLNRLNLSRSIMPFALSDILFQVRKESIPDCHIPKESERLELWHALPVHRQTDSFLRLIENENHYHIPERWSGSDYEERSLQIIPNLWQIE